MRSPGHVATSTALEPVGRTSGDHHIRDCDHPARGAYRNPVPHTARHVVDQLNGFASTVPQSLMDVPSNAWRSRDREHPRTRPYFAWPEDPPTHSFGEPIRHPTNPSHSDGRLGPTTPHRSGGQRHIDRADRRHRLRRSADARPTSRRRVCGRRGTARRLGRPRTVRRNSAHRSGCRAPGPMGGRRNGRW